ncbi:copper amine oxidase N-terminal domain-containing protein [Paenibacillus sp. CH40]|uniref:copper amine oxidase N-terminal domain-containing protein n=1 Tax=Paenibacillus sp. CH40 TaxID=2962045 RepID=UPI0020B812F6|nr:copper amine oxidase N-terminal domain-containing protein [Paenibacillus sp. CH40]MCP3793738.1 copper amine oxidase N-terminal domain-containing protein [Paenibacillus sp. CH40]
MNKKMYMFIGALLGVLLVTSGGAAADQVKSLVGKTVAGEYNVRVNGTTLSENAIAVDGTAYVPLRSISESLGANLAVKGKTIEIATGTPSSNVVVKEQSQAIALKDNPYTNWSKELIVKHIGTVEELIEILNNNIKKHEKSLTDIDRKIGTAGHDQRLIERIEKSATKTKKELQESKDSLLEHKKELEQLKAALATK